MLIIGSDAARHYFHDFRRPKDCDIVVSESEMKNLRKGFNWEKTPKRSNKYRSKIAGTIFEAEVGVPGSSAEALLEYYENIEMDREHTTNLLYVKDVKFVEPKVLLLLKYTALKYGLDWLKHIRDYYFLKARAGESEKSEDLEKILNLRQQEVDDFHKNNKNWERDEKYWEGNAKNKLYKHEQIHKATCIGDKPIYQGAGHLTLEKFQSFTYEEQCNIIAEEGFALATERIIGDYIDAGVRFVKFDRYSRFIDAISLLTTKLAPEWMRDFIIDNYLNIASNSFDFWDKFRSYKASSLKLAKNTEENKEKHEAIIRFRGRY